MVKGNSVDDHELAEVILIGVVVPVPGYHIKWGVVLQKETHKLMIKFYSLTRHEVHTCLATKRAP